MPGQELLVVVEERASTSTMWTWCRRSITRARTRMLLLQVLVAMAFGYCSLGHANHITLQSVVMDMDDAGYINLANRSNMTPRVVNSRNQMLLNEEDFDSGVPASRSFGNHTNTLEAINKLEQELKFLREELSHDQLLILLFLISHL